MSNKDIAISVKNVYKSFRLPHEQHSGIKSAILSIFKKNRKRGYETQQVLEDISFDIKKGEFFGIVGRNGSGKSTLLKLISEIYIPDKGEIQVNGKLTPFIELGVGFNHELTGRENVYLNGALFGFSNKQMDAMYDEIVEFAELERFMDQKLKNYSSGMQVRLAFSIAIRADTDILVLDEVLAVGDEAFQRKCYMYFAELKRKKKTVILVTHSMDNVTRFCDRALMLEAGKIIEKGSVKTVSERYISANADAIENDTKQTKDKQKNEVNSIAKAELTLEDSNGKLKKFFRNDPDDRKLNIKATVSILKDINKEIFCSLLIKNMNGEIITRIASEDIEDTNKLLTNPRAGDKIIIESEIQNIYSEGDYFIAVSLKSIDRSETYIESEDKASFTVSGLGINGFSLRPDNVTSVRKV